jgi:hypothetical protein
MGRGTHRSRCSCSRISVGTSRLNKPAALMLTPQPDANWDDFFVTLREEWEANTENPDDETEFQRFLFVCSVLIFDFIEEN